MLHFIGLMVCLVLALGCGTTLHLKPGQYLMKKDPGFKALSELEKPDSALLKKLAGAILPTKRLSLNKEQLEAAIKTTTNRKILIIKPYLHLYNLGLSLQKYEYPFERFYKFFFRQSTIVDTIGGFLVNVAGEPPVLLDTALVRTDVQNLNDLYFSKGFFHSQVLPNVDTLQSAINAGKVKLTFYIQEGMKANFDSVEFQCPELEIYNWLMKTRESSYLKKGEKYDESHFEKERTRIDSLLKNNGYYSFNMSSIRYDLDTVFHPKQLQDDAYLGVFARVIVESNAKPYTIGMLSLKVEPFGADTAELYYLIRKEGIDEAYRKEIGMLKREWEDLPEMRFLIHSRAVQDLNLKFLGNQIQCKEGQIYSYGKERQSVIRLQELGIFRTVLVRHELNDSTGKIDILFDARLDKKFQAKAGLEGFSQGNRNDQIAQQNFYPGFGGQLTLRDKKFFRGAERLELSARGNMSFYQPANEKAWRTLYELGVSSTFTVPRLMVPFGLARKLKMGNPSTFFSVKYETQRRVEFTRDIIGLNWSYTWFHGNSRKYRSSVSPYIINLINSNLSPSFEQSIRDLSNAFLKALLLRDYLSRFSSKFSYRFTYSDYGTTREKSTQLFQPVFEFGGNTPYLIDAVFRPDSTLFDNRIKNVQYGQFVKISAEYKRMFPIQRRHTLVFRAFSGVGTPWNQTSLIPFEARYYSGGANSMRGWQSNTLGPGRWKWGQVQGETPELEYLLFPGGDFIFESNLEYRYKMTKLIEIAFFTDLGNVWFLPTSNFQFDEGKLKLENFQPGWDAGMGLRLDFSFFVFRIDYAHQLFSPDLGKFAFYLLDSELATRRYQFNFGIGHPF